MMPLAHDMIGLYLAVANNNHMAPWGGIEALLGTNPIADCGPGADGAAGRARHRHHRDLVRQDPQRRR